MKRIIKKRTKEAKHQPPSDSATEQTLRNLKLIEYATHPLVLPLATLHTMPDDLRTLVDEFITDIIGLPNEVLSQRVSAVGGIDQEVIDLFVNQLFEIAADNSHPGATRAAETIEVFSTPAARVLFAVALAKDSTPTKRQLAVELSQKVVPGWIEPASRSVRRESRPSPTAPLT